MLGSIGKWHGGFAAGCLCLGLSLTFVVSADENAAAAAGRLVVARHLGDPLSALASAVVAHTQTYRMITARVGATPAQAALHRHLMRLTPQYQAAWNQRLAGCYAAQLPAAVLDDVAARGAESRQMASFTAAVPRVEQCMHQQGRPVLNDLSTAALQALYGELMPRS